MNKNEMQRVMARANVGPGSMEQAQALAGIAVDRYTRYVTLAGAAAHIRWQCLLFSGEWDGEALQDEMFLLRKYAVLLD